MFYTIGLLSKTKPYLKTILIHEANKTIKNEKDWLLTFAALIGFYLIEEKITNLELLHHSNSLIRAVAIQLIDSRSSEQILSAFADNHITVFISAIDRSIMQDVSDEIKLKFLNELSNPDNYPYMSENIDENSVTKLRDSVGDIVHSWTLEI